MFGKQLSVFTPRRRKEYLVTPPPSPSPSSSSSFSSSFFTKRYASSLPDIPSFLLRGAGGGGGGNGGRVAWNIRNARMVEERLRGRCGGDDRGDGRRKWMEDGVKERETRREGGIGNGRKGGEGKEGIIQNGGKGGEEGGRGGGMENGGRGGGNTSGGGDICMRQGGVWGDKGGERERVRERGYGGREIKGEREGGGEEEKETNTRGGEKPDPSHLHLHHHLQHHHQHHHLDHHQALPIRDRSRVGVRSSLPFTTAPHSSSSSSGVSSGASDTQSQGSAGGDSKSDSPTPEGTRKNGEASSSSAGVVAGVSVRCGKGHELSVPAARASAPPGVRESAALRQEVETLRAEITKARQTILHMQDREKKLKDRLGDRAARGVERGNLRVENVSLGERRPTALVRKYGNLYAQARVDTLDSLDTLPDLKNAEELKSKLLFSVVVLAFRSASSSAQALREEVRRVLQVPPPPPSSGEAHDSHHHSYDSQSFSLEQAVSSFISANIEKRDLSKNVEEVCQQIWATLYDYPALKSCDGLLQYVKDCVRLAWGLSNQMPPYVIDYETRTFRKDYHVRFHVADPDSDAIKTYLWPALLEGPGGVCVQKGVVIT